MYMGVWGTVERVGVCFVWLGGEYRRVMGRMGPFQDVFCDAG